MKTTDYPGLDYSGPGSTVNRDTKTGIRYGIIAINSCGEWTWDELQNHGTDGDFDEYREELSAKVRAAVAEALSDFPERFQKQVADAACEAAEEDCGDHYEQPGDNTRYHYEKDGYVLQTTSDGNIFVIKSPYVTNAQFCSPCVPGAGNLNSPCPDGPECYCLGEDWFDENNPCPYPVRKLEVSV